MPGKVILKSHGRHCGKEIKMKITRLLVVLFVVFGSAIPLSHAGNQSVRAVAPSHTLKCCEICPPICPRPPK